MNIVETAKNLARMLLRGQTDKAGRPAFDHAERVANSSLIKFYLDAAVAFLHDVIEDTQATTEDLCALGFPEEVVQAVELLTRPHNLTYGEYIARLAQSGNRVAVRVKLADIADHLEPVVGFQLPDSLRERYLAARVILQAVPR